MLTIRRQVLCLTAFLVLLLVSCGNEKTAFIEDEPLKIILLQELETEGVWFRQDGNAIHYKVRDAKQFEAIFHRSLSKRPEDFGFYEKHKQLEFVSRLNEAGISSTIDENNGMFIVYVPKQDSEKAHVIFKLTIMGDQTKEPMGANRGK